MNLPSGLVLCPVPVDEVLDKGKVDIDRLIRMTVALDSGGIIHREYHDFRSVGPMHEPHVVVEKMEAALLNVGSKLPPPQ